MGTFKDRLYNALVRKNGRVWYEYERYVRENIEEHRLHRFKHLVILLKLNWFYRVKKGNTPYLYWDVPLEPTVQNKVSPKNEQKKQINTRGVAKNQGNANICESRKYPVTESVHFAKEFAQYDCVIFGIFGTLLYSTLNDKKNFYDLVGRVLRIPNYRIIREKVEKEIEFARKYSGENRVKSLTDIYKLMSNYINMDIEKCVEIENKIFKGTIKSNPYVKEIYEMVSYNSNKIILVDNSIYGTKVIEEILIENGFQNYQELLLSYESEHSYSNEVEFKYIKEEYRDSNIIIYDANKARVKSAGEILNCKTWQYRNALQVTNALYSNKMTNFTGDLYRSMVSQHLYCGHYVDTLQYEVGYIYFGILVVGYILWLKKQIEETGIDKVLFLESTSDFLQKCYGQVSEDNSGETLWITQTTAIKILTLEHPIYFYSIFIEQYLGTDRNVAFFLEKMDLLCLADELNKVGLKPAENINRNSPLYGIFIDFIEDKFDFIKQKYVKDIESTVEYLKTLNLKNRNIAIVSVTGDGTLARALDIILNKQLQMNCSIKEFSAIQSEKRTDLLSNEWGKAYICAEDSLGSNVVGNAFLLSRVRNILGNISPVFDNFRFGDEGTLKFEFREACPWAYKKLAMNQEGILDFFTEYMDALVACQELDVNVKQEDVVAVLEKLLEKSTDYLKNGVVYIRS